MITLAQNGVQYRTRLMDRSRADRFARCLRANPHFDGVMLNESGRARNPVCRFFVTFHPRNPDALLALVDRVQAEQDARAEAQWFDYLVVEADGGQFFYVENLNSGEVYECHPLGGCTCPHYENRLRGSALRCKHARIIEIHQALGTAITWEQAISATAAPVPTEGAATPSVATPPALDAPAHPEDCPLCDGWEFVQRTNHPLIGQRCPHCHPAFRTAAA